MAFIEAQFSSEQTTKYLFLSRQQITAAQCQFQVTKTFSDCECNNNSARKVNDIKPSQGFCKLTRNVGKFYYKVLLIFLHVHYVFNSF